MVLPLPAEARVLWLVAVAAVAAISAAAVVAWLGIDRSGRFYRVRMHPRIFVTRRIADVGLKLLSAHCRLDIWEHPLPPSRADLIQRSQGCFGILSMITERFDAEVLDAIGPTLKAIANYGVGFNNIDLNATRARGIQVGNTPNALTNATADVAVGLMLAAGRHFLSGIDAVRHLAWKTWEPLAYVGQEFERKTLGIVGLGRIGEAVAKRCAGGWGMKILYTSRTPKPDAESRLNGTRVSLEELLRASDVVSLHADLNASTRHLINRDAFSMMKANAVFLNTARGEMVDQVALYEALKNQSIFAAGLDVTDPEPLPDDSPLRSLSNCLILPHLGSATWVARNRMSEIAATNLLHAMQGQPMVCPVP